MCSKAGRHRSIEMLPNFRTTGNVEDKVKWKKARARATRTFREENKNKWQSYVDTLSINTKASLVWRKIRSICGRPPSQVNMIKEKNILYTSIEITENLAQSFQEITSNLNYDPQFVLYKVATKQE